MATEKGERRRQALTAAAGELLREGGFDAVRHRAVAERAGLPLASTTYYFDSLDDLVTAAVELTGRQDLDAGRAALDAGADPHGIVLDQLLGQGSRDGGLDAVLLRYEHLVGTGRRPYLAPLMRKLRVELDAILAEALARAGQRLDGDGLRRVVETVDGAVISALIEADPDPRATALAALRRALT